MTDFERLVLQGIKIIICILLNDNRRENMWTVIEYQRALDTYV